jgi:general secretion pathway protein I
MPGPESRSVSREGRGFTLLEVLIAFAIAAVALGALSRLFSIGIVTQAAAGRLADAVALAEEQLALAEQGTLPGDGLQEGRSENGLKWRRSITPLAASAAGDDGPLTAYEVQVTVSWDAAGRSKSITLSSLAFGGGP